MSAPTQFVHTQGTKIVGIDGEPVRLRGVCLGGWLNMENFITGFSANESLMRSGVLRRPRAETVTSCSSSSLLSHFFGDGRRPVPRLRRSQLGADPAQLPSPRGRRPPLRGEG